MYLWQWYSCLFRCIVALSHIIASSAILRSVVLFCIAIIAYISEIVVHYCAPGTPRLRLQIAARGQHRPWHTQHNSTVVGIHWEIQCRVHTINIWFRPGGAAFRLWTVKGKSDVSDFCIKGETLQQKQLSICFVSLFLEPASCIQVSVILPRISSFPRCAATTHARPAWMVAWTTKL